MFQFRTIFIVTVICVPILLLRTMSCLLNLYIYSDVTISSGNQDDVSRSDVRDSISEFKMAPRVIKTFYPLTLYSPYVINTPDICTNVTNLKYLVIVHTASSNFHRRRAMRGTWANKNLFKKLNSRIVFFLGLPKHANIQRSIQNESTVYQDIVQGDFLDTYKNLTHKGVLAFRWISEHCAQPEMIVKVDDDVFVNPFILVTDFLPKLKTRNRHILCHHRKVGSSKIFRTGDGYKWIADKDQFRGYHDYPYPYCDGLLVLLSPDLILPLYQAATFSPFFWVDDLYLFGILPAMVGNVTYQDIFHSMAMARGRGVKCYTVKKGCHYLAVNTRTCNETETLWAAVLKQLSDQMKNQLNMNTTAE